MSSTSQSMLRQSIQIHIMFMTGTWVTVRRKNQIINGRKKELSASLVYAHSQCKQICKFQHTNLCLCWDDIKMKNRGAKKQRVGGHTVDVNHHRFHRGKPSAISLSTGIIFPLPAVYQLTKKNKKPFPSFNYIPIIPISICFGCQSLVSVVF